MERWVIRAGDGRFLVSTVGSPRGGIRAVWANTGECVALATRADAQALADRFDTPCEVLEVR